MQIVFNRPGFGSDILHLWCLLLVSALYFYELMDHIGIEPKMLVDMVSLYSAFQLFLFSL